MTTSEEPFDLTCWYINQRRVMELVGPEAVARCLAALQHLDDHQRELATLAIYKSLVVSYIRTQRVETLGTLLTNQEVLEGRLFTHYSDFWFKGLPKLYPDARCPQPNGTAIGYAKLDAFEEGLRIEFSFHPEHLTSNTAWTQMSGHKRKFIFGTIQKLSEGRLTAIPYVVGDIIIGRDSLASAGYWLNHREIYVDSIDNFSAIANYRPKFTKSSLDALKGVSEERIKHAFAEIIGEPSVPKDWGGERSDLFSTHVFFEGRRRSTAFLFKGPSKFRPMTMADLGKNGDQIDRLFSEPADILILQHCHEVRNSVRAVMRAYAERVGNPRLFCIIDGYDTLRILQTFRKCGLAPDLTFARSQEIA